MFFNEDMTSTPNILIEASNIGLEPGLAGIYRIIAESNEDWHILREKMMRLEHDAIISEDEYLISEGAGDFFIGIANFFKKIWAKIKEIWNRFVNWVSKAVSSDKAFVKNYKRNYKINTTGFKYKGWKWNINAVRLPNAVDSTLRAVANNPNTFAKRNAAYNIKEFSEKEENYDNFRGKICGASKVSSDRFQKVLMDTMRGGAEKREMVPDVNKYLSVIENADKSIGEIKNDRDSMDKLYAKCISHFEGVAKEMEKSGSKNEIIKTDYVSDSFEKKGSTDTGYTRGSHAVRGYMRIGANAQATIARKYSSIINVAFGAKIEAVKQQRNEYRAVISKLASYKPKQLNASYDFMSESVLDNYYFKLEIPFKKVSLILS